MVPVVEVAVQVVLEFVGSALNFAPEALDRRRPKWVKAIGFAVILAGLAIVLLLNWSALA